MGTMYLEALLATPTIRRLLHEATPLRLHMTRADLDTRWLEVDKPEVIEMVPGVGLRVTTRGRLRYRAFGIDFPIRLHSLTLLARPRVTRTDAGQLAIELRLDIEKADLVNVPALIDRGIVALVNAQLTPKATRTIWPVSNALSSVFALPSRLEPLSAFSIELTGAALEVAEEGLVLQFELSQRLSRHKERPDDAERGRPVTPELPGDAVAPSQ